MKISVIIVASGDHINRYTNALKQLECLRNQTTQPLEVIYVEQTIDGNYYFNQLPIQFDDVKYKYIPIKFKTNLDLFCVSWCRNVGIYKAKGDVVIALDVDYVFDNYYLEKISELDIQDAYVGWNTIYYIQSEEKLKYMQYGIFPKGEEEPLGLYRSKLICDSGDGHVGGSEIFNRQWFIDNLVGFSEDMFGWGAEDNDVYARARSFIGTKRVFNYKIYHLNHGQKQKQKLITKVVWERNCKNIPETHKLMRAVGLGNPDHPSPIYKDSIQWSL
jgi:glycosyltransferase involved in cell wall biosynthesis